MKKRIISLLLAVVMLFSCMSVSIFAAEGDQGTEATGETQTVYDNGALDDLVGKHTGELYQWNDWTLDTDDVLWVDGYWKSEDNKLFATFVNNESASTKIEYLTGRNTDEMGNNEVKSSDGEAQFLDVVKPATWNMGNPDVTVSYVPGLYDMSQKQYVVFSVEIKRGEALTNTTFMRLRFCGDKNNIGSTTAGKGFASNENGKLKLNGIVVGDFSTSLYTTITGVYDQTNNKMTLYANGIKVGEEYILFDDASKTNFFRDLSWWYGNTACQGRIFSIKNVRCAILNDNTNLESCVNATDKANGVFKIDGDYYLFENGMPVTGTTRSVDGYTIVTEADTGKIVKCYKAQADANPYQRWTAEEYSAAGVTLARSGYAVYSGYGNTQTGYRLIKTIKEDDIEYYIFTTNTVTVPEQSDKDKLVTKDWGDGFEFVQKLNGGSITTYRELPESKETYEENGVSYYKVKTSEFTAEFNNKIVNEKKNKQSTGLDITNLYNLYNDNDQNSYITESGNINFRIKAGAGISETGTAVRFRFKYNNSIDSNYFNAGTIKKNDTDNKFHLYMSDVDCGILAEDIYTDITMHTYISESKLYYDLYVNGALKASKLLIETDQMKNNNGQTVNNYRYTCIGTYIGGITFTESYITWGVTQVYYGDKVNNYDSTDATKGYTGTVTTVNGTYTYTNGIITAFDANAASDNALVLDSYSVTLGEKLGMNFYAKLSANATTAVITVGDEARVVDLTKLNANADGLTKISSSVSSIDVNEQIKIAFYDAEGNVLDIVTKDGTYEGIYITSVKAYADTLIATGNADTVAMANALLNYAAYAEKYFNNNCAFDTLHAQSERKTVTDVTANDIKGTLKASVVESGDTNILGTVQLVLDNATKIRVHLNVESKDEVTLTNASDNVLLVEKDGAVYIDIYNIDAKNLNTAYTFTVNNVKVEISVLGVAKSVVSRESSDADLVNLMKALWLYSQAAEKLA